MSADRFKTRSKVNDSGSWNKYSYVHNDPVNHLDPTGREECDPDDPDDPCYCAEDDSSCDGGGGGGGTQPPVRGNPCAYGNLTSGQQSLIGQGTWNNQTAKAQQEFTDITSDASALGLALSGFSASITVAGQSGATQTELNLQGTSAAVLALINSLGGNFTSEAQDPLVVTPHAGFTGNYRQNTLTWSLQVNTNVATGAVQIDIDPFNPSYGLAGLFGQIWQVGSNTVTGNDTNPFRAMGALQRQGISVLGPCTGGA